MEKYKNHDDDIDAFIDDDFSGDSILDFGDYLSLSDSLQRVHRCSSAIRELDLLSYGLWYALECLICCLYHVQV